MKFSTIKKRYFGDSAYYKRLFAVALPIMIQNGITNFVNMLDNIMVGRIGTVEMTGVAIANQLLFVFNLCIFGAISGAGIFSAQFHGKGNNEGVTHTFRFKLMICIFLTAVGALTLYFFGDKLVALYLQGEGEVADAQASLEYAGQYIEVMLFGLLPFALTQSYAGTLRETNHATLPMVAGMSAVLVNMTLNYVLIFGKFGAPKLGVVGAAIATVISRFVELLIISIWTHTHNKANPFIIGAYRSFYIPKALVKSIIIKGTPLLLNEALWSFGMAFINQCYSVRSYNIVSANNISQTFWNLFSVVFMATGVAIGIISGQLLGAKEFDKARDTVRKTMVFSVFFSIIIGVAYSLCAEYIPLLYETSDDVRALATNLMVISACFMPMCAFTHASYFTIRSGGNTLITFLFDSMFMWVIVAPLAYCLSRFTSIPILWLYGIVQATEVIKATIGYILLKKGIWIKNIVDTKN